MLACKDSPTSAGKVAKLIGIEPLKELPVHNSLLSTAASEEMFPSQLVNQNVIQTYPAC